MDSATPSSPATDGGHFDVVVIGGGAAGTLVATHLLAADGPTLRVALVEPRACLAQGVAYSTPREEHLLNVVAARMSAFDDQPGHFVEWLRADPARLPGVDPDQIGAAFAPRALYARYLHALLDGQPRRDQLVALGATVVALVRGQDGHRLQLDDGRALTATSVVLASGNLPAGLPVPAGAVAPGSRVIEAWDYDGVAGIAADADVVVVGSGLSMVDVALTLSRNGHRGRLQVLSRHGLAPLAHAAPGAHGAPRDTSAWRAMGVRARLRALREDVRQAQADGQPWQVAIDALRRDTQALWASWPEAEQRRFLRHAVRYWDIHRHRIAPQAAALLDDARAQGRLSLHAGRLLAVRDVAGRSQVVYAPRGEGGQATLAADVVVNATGMDKRATAARGSLVAALHAQGLVRPGPHAMGIATVGDGQPVDASGQAVPGLWTLGALRLGDLWETIAMPELRGQAARAAAAARAHALTVPAPRSGSSGR